MVPDHASTLPELIQDNLLLMRGEKVILSPDLATLYGVEARILLQAVKRNPLRFPPDFMFQLTHAEWEYVARTRSPPDLSGPSAAVKC